MRSAMNNRRGFIFELDSRGIKRGGRVRGKWNIIRVLIRIPNCGDSEEVEYVS